MYTYTLQINDIFHATNLDQPREFVQTVDYRKIVDMRSFNPEDLVRKTLPANMPVYEKIDVGVELSVVDALPRNALKNGICTDVCEYVHNVVSNKGLAVVCDNNENTMNEIAKIVKEACNTECTATVVKLIRRFVVRDAENDMNLQSVETERLIEPKVKELDI